MRLHQCPARSRQTAGGQAVRRSVLVRRACTSSGDSTPATAPAAPTAAPTAAPAPAAPQRSAAKQRPPVTDEDRQYMMQALHLAKRALGKTHPNPAVGCVIVKRGEVVGEGFHPKAGMPHAEVYALRAAGNKAKGATAYVTLEPCNHFGLTPPCSRALVDAKVARVVVGVGDPNPLVASEGIATLEKAGIQVSIMDGPEREACYAVNADFMARMEAAAKSG